MLSNCLVTDYGKFAHLAKVACQISLLKMTIFPFPFSLKIHHKSQLTLKIWELKLHFPKEELSTLIIWNFSLYGDFSLLLHLKHLSVIYLFHYWLIGIHFILLVITQYHIIYIVAKMAQLCPLGTLLGCLLCLVDTPQSHLGMSMLASLF